MTTLRGELARYFTVAEWKKGLVIKVAYVLLHQADILLTSFALSAGFQEINPVIRASLETPVLILVLKLFIPLIIAWLVPARLLIPAIVLLLVIVGFNLAQLAALL
jgi:hypothetical protein